MRYLTTVLSGLTVLAALQSTPVLANDGDAVLGGLIGGAFGAAVGHQINGRHGAIVGAALGGATGVALATEPRRYERDVTYRREETRYEEPRYEESSYEEPRYYEEQREIIRVQPRYERRVVIREETPVYYYARPAPIVYVRDHHWHHHDWDRDWRDHDRDHGRWNDQPRKKRWDYD